MSVALKHTVRVAALVVLVAGLSGCGSENPMSPSMVATPVTETAVAVMPIEQDPGMSEDTAIAPAPTEDRAAQRQGKKPKKDNPGQHRGWDNP